MFSEKQIKTTSLKGVCVDRIVLQMFEFEKLYVLMIFGIHDEIDFKI